MPSSWKKDRCIQWLKDNPIPGPSPETAFLEEKAKEIIGKVEELKNGEAGVGQGKNWTGLLPFLRSIQCLLNDEVRGLYIHRNDPKTGQQLDARNSTTRSPTAF